MTATERRLLALEQRAAAANPRPTSEPFWSEAHGCMMENHGGFILPIVLTPEAWEEAAIAHMTKITGQS